jgi:two-component system OmpR family response regulator
MGPAGNAQRDAPRDPQLGAQLSDAPDGNVLPAKVAVLVVEDDAALLGMVGTALRFEGFKVETAGNGAEGLNCLRRTTPDLILLDLVLPWINGLEVLATLRSSPATEDVPVIVMTGTATRPQDLNGLGPVDIVHKPFEIERLMTLITNVLSRPRGRSRKVQLAQL